MIEAEPLGYRGEDVMKSAVSKKLSAEFGRRGGSAKSEAKAEAARLNGKLGGRPSTRNAPRETFDLQVAIARFRRAVETRTQVAGLLACDLGELTVPERAELRTFFKTLQRIEKRWETAVEEHQLETAQDGL